MFRVIFGIFIILHGLVHLLYAGQSRRIFELQPDMVWPDGSWVLHHWAEAETIRVIAAVLLLICAIVFVVGGGGLLLKQEWWRLIVVLAAACSSLLYLLLWDGVFQELANKGGVGILINLAILAAVFILKL